MSAETTFRCPVCRASQSLREVCRRCHADLRLLLRAHRRLAYVKRLQTESQELGDREVQQTLSDELRWLSPRR